MNGNGNGNGNAYCNNCGKCGHILNDCKNPITSIGIISFKYNNTTSMMEYLLIQRNNSFGFVEFIRGKYPLYNIQYIQTLINEMTIDEKTKLLTMNFEDLWSLLWGEYSNNQYRSEEISSKDKFELLKRGIKIRNNEFSIQTLIDSSNTSWLEPEWGFPKGRRNYQEKDIDCGIREFMEETGYGINDFKLIENIIPYEEIFIGSNIKSYKHKYYLAYMVNNNVTLETKKYQKSEVRNMKWMSYDECLNVIRPYNLEKINIVEKINKVLQEYRLY
jgi:8-oxo-dGTP pyrophosphatase MutT (NUDIX family)